jgi:hypothetical protein
VHVNNELRRDILEWVSGTSTEKATERCNCVWMANCYFALVGDLSKICTREGEYSYA